MIDHPETTNRFHDLLGYTQALQTPGGLGAYSIVMQGEIKKVTSILEALQKHYQQAFNSDRKLSRKLNDPAFLHRRNALLNQLDDGLRLWLRRRLIGSNEDVVLRKRLGLRSKRIIHRWKEAGTAAQGLPQVKSCIDMLNRSARTAKAIGFIGIGLDVAWSAAEIDRHIQENRPQRNREIVGEAHRLVGSVAGGAAGGTAGYLACNLVLAVPTAGTSLFWCGIVAGGMAQSAQAILAPAYFPKAARSSMTSWKRWSAGEYWRYDRRNSHTCWHSVRLSHHRRWSFGRIHPSAQTSPPNRA